MRSLNSRGFLWAWQTLYGASNPGHLKDHWEVDGTDWTKERHAYWSEHYSVQHEVHRLRHHRAGKIEWEFLVVGERWWGRDRAKAIRDICWCRAMSGRPDRILAWMRKQEARQCPSDFVDAAPD